ncbi:hypothetical protein Tco_1090306 [Tanacetum coccineum]|uniref:Uncharacterized protein n=1 Tax=Tanacetum coccineum TaxID=301880 RepID=A0ABQ5I3U2_9ASTR
MEISIADQIALDDALVAPADRLKIGKCNLRLSSDVTSKEATLQVVYDVLKLTFLQGIQVTADGSQRSICKNSGLLLIDILQICPKVGNKKFEEPPLEKEILAFLASLGHSGDIRKITDVNVNKLHQPWRSFAGYHTQILKQKYKKGMRCTTLRFTKLFSTFVMDNRPSNSSKKQGSIGTMPEMTQCSLQSMSSQGMKPLRTIPPKTKGSKKKANTDTITKQKPPTAPKEKKSGKGKQKTTELETISEADLTEAEQLKIITKSDDDQDDEQAQDDEDADKNDVNETKQDDEDDDEHDDNETDQNDDDEEQTESDDDGDDFVHPKLTTHDDDIIHEEETDEDDSFDPTIHTPSRISSSDDEDSDNEVEGANVEGAKSDEDATYEEDQGNEASKIPY